jgi:hypothetical protein
MAIDHASGGTSAQLSIEPKETLLVDEVLTPLHGHPSDVPSSSVVYVHDCADAVAITLKGWTSDASVWVAQ